MLKNPQKRERERGRKDNGRQKERKKMSNTKFNTRSLLKQKKNEKTKNCCLNWCAHQFIRDEFPFQNEKYVEIDVFFLFFWFTI